MEKPGSAPWFEVNLSEALVYFTSKIIFYFCFFLWREGMPLVMFLILRGSAESFWLNYNKTSEVIVSVLIIAKLVRKCNLL